ncbi:MAG TPA: glycoside hydrolase family 3 protein, partial [Candidatus Dormibacteraeota bacterium]|nr:glycoside hydrolase family 3 protein [Candidatus Dormibacteraeota bacterium]
MTRVESLALRCLMPGFEGTSVPEWVRRKAAAGLGAVAIYARNVESREQLEALNENLHRERPDLVVAIDEEGGDVTRLEARTGSSYPGNYALGVVGDV